MKASKSDMSPKEFFNGDKKWGNMNVSWNEYSKVPDQTQLLKGLPDNLCQCPHWGYIVKGSIRIKYRDYDEVVSEGEVYYMQPGHIPIFEDNCEIIEFSPKEEYRDLLEVIDQNIEAMKNENK